MVLCGTMSRMQSRPATASPPKARRPNEAEARRRILDAAFAVFVKRGYAHASTLEIATRAKVSKRDLYTLVGRKEQMLVACISERATRLQWPRDIALPQDRATLTRGLRQFGYQLLREITDPTVIAIFRLAIAEAEHNPEIARTLEEVGQATARHALNRLFEHATARGLVHGDATEMARRYSALLWGDLMLRLLLHVVERPGDMALEQQAHQAAEVFMSLYRKSGG